MIYSFLVTIEMKDKLGKDLDSDNTDNPSRRIRLEHLISFSDAIFAFSITFMAISIQIPNFPVNHMTEEQFISKLLQLLPELETRLTDCKSTFHEKSANFSIGDRCH